MKRIGALSALAVTIWGLAAPAEAKIGDTLESARALAKQYDAVAPAFFLDRKGRVVLEVWGAPAGLWTMQEADLRRTILVGGSPARVDHGDKIVSFTTRDGATVTYELFEGRVTTIKARGARFNESEFLEQQRHATWRWVQDE